MWISTEGGVAVMPQSISLSTRKASDVRNIEPILFRLRILSSTIVRGIFFLAR